MGWTGRKNQCQACGQYGHNRRSCPTIKEAHANIQARLEKYGIEADPSRPVYSWVDALNEMAANSHGVKDSDELYDVAPDDWTGSRQAWWWQEVEEREAQKRWNKENGVKSNRRCGFCGKPGHNRRKCEKLEKHKRDCRAMKALAHRVARHTFEKSGIVPGALVQYREWNYVTREYANQVGFIQAINWSEIGKQDEDIDHGLERGLESWIFRGNVLQMRRPNGEVSHVQMPRNFEQQTEYYHGMNNDNYSLIGPVHGSSVNLDGYEGDNKFPVEKSVHIWGEKFLDKKFGREVKKIVLEVAPELRSMHG